MSGLLISLTNYQYNMSNRDIRVLLNNLYYDLLVLSKDYDSGFEELINSFEITRKEAINKDWIYELCSDKTIENLSIFIEEWNYLLRTKSYACIGVFMQLDPDWLMVVNGSLTNVIESIKLDLKELKWNFTESHMFLRKRDLSNQQLLEVANYITKLAILTDSSVNPFYTE